MHGVRGDYRVMYEKLMLQRFCSICSQQGVLWRISYEKDPLAVQKKPLPRQDQRH